MRFKLYSIDLLRGFAAFGIVGCHLALANLSSEGWQTRALCDLFVGLFAALSGFLMWKGGDEAWLSYAAKRCKRLLPTYAAWTIGYLAFGVCFDLVIRHAISPGRLALSHWPNIIFRGDASCHLWFLISLFYAQLIFKAALPWVRKVRFLDKALVGVSLGLVLYISYSAYRFNWHYYYFMRLVAFLIGGYGLRALIGAEISQSGLKSAAWMGVAVIGIAAHYACASVVPNFVRDWWVAMPLLLAFVYMPMEGEKICRVAGQLGATSMGVFLIHPVITAANNLWVGKLFHAPFGPAAVLADWIVSWAIAFAITSIAIRIAWLKRWWS